MFDKLVIVVLHVDDQNVFSTSMKLIADFKPAMQAQFGIDDIDETKYFLGIQNLRHKSTEDSKNASAQVR